jgi:hypothetical protein
VQVKTSFGYDSVHIVANGLHCCCCCCCCCCRYHESHEQLSEAKLERLFLYSVTWSLGGLLSEKERPVFDAELRSFAGNMPPK